MKTNEKELTKRQISLILNQGVFAVRSTLEEINEITSLRPKAAFRKVIVDTKPALFVDLHAENNFEAALKKGTNGISKIINNITIYGEESLTKEGSENIDLRKANGIVVLVDMVDGTDLLERGLSNWCSAIIFFQPKGKPGRRIIAAIVGLPNGDIYYASDDRKNAWVRRNKQKEVEVAGASTVKKAKEASICFYGQKAGSFSDVAKQPFVYHLKGEKNPRLYTLAGIPMMVKLIDHRVKEARNIDAVIEVSGQWPHDAVAGAYIALKAGATLKNPFKKGRTTEFAEIGFKELEEHLMRPANKDFKLKYILASTDDLCNELCTLVTDPSQFSKEAAVAS